MTRRHVLLAEDHEQGLRSMAQLLRSAGHAVTTARTVAGAVALGMQNPVDVLVSDMALPDGDGCELLRRLRHSFGGRHLPAVAITALAERDWIERCREAGYGTFLPKPVNLGDLLAAIGSPAPPSLGGVPTPSVPAPQAADGRRLLLRLDLERIRLNLEDTAEAAQSDEDVLRLLAGLGVFRKNDDWWDADDQALRNFREGEILERRSQDRNP